MSDQEERILGRLRALRIDEVVGWMDWPELVWLYQLAAAATGTLVEVGAYRGRSTCALVAGLADSELPLSWLVCVDTFDGRGTTHPPTTPTEGYRHWETSLRDRRLPVPVALIDESVAIAETFVPASACAVFVDASHDEASVTADIAAWRRIVRPGGILCGHDYDPSWPGVPAAVDAAFGDTRRTAPGSIWWVTL